MQIDELPAGEQNQCPDMDMNRVVGTHDIPVSYTHLKLPTTSRV